jgi:hypothetical protein
VRNAPACSPFIPKSVSGANPVTGNRPTRFDFPRPPRKRRQSRDLDAAPPGNPECPRCEVVHARAGRGCPSRDVVHAGGGRGCPKGKVVHARDRRGCPSGNVVHPLAERGCPSREVGHTRRRRGCPARDVVHAGAGRRCPAREVVQARARRGCPSREVVQARARRARAEAEAQPWRRSSRPAPSSATAVSGCSSASDRVVSSDAAASIRTRFASSSASAIASRITR